MTLPFGSRLQNYRAVAPLGQCTSNCRLDGVRIEHLNHERNRRSVLVHSDCATPTPMSPFKFRNGRGTDECTPLILIRTRVRINIHVVPTVYTADLSCDPPCECAFQGAIAFLQPLVAKKLYVASSLTIWKLWREAEEAICHTKRTNFELSLIAHYADHSLLFRATHISSNR